MVTATSERAANVRLWDETPVVEAPSMTKFERRLFHGEMEGRRVIGEAMYDRVKDLDHTRCEAGEEDAFFVADLGEVYRQYLRFQRHLPRIRPFYAVKCNPDPQVLRLLAALDTGFDCASKGEVEQVLGLGIAADRIIYAQPCKTTSYLRCVRDAGVKRMTFDNVDELYKIARHHPDAELVLRIITDDSSSLVRLSMKFGAPLDTTDELLSVARDLGLNVVGVSFHIGSGTGDPSSFARACADARAVWERARGYGFAMHLLDVGGGFCADSFEHCAAVLHAALDEHFPASMGVQVIAEPGRFFVANAFTIACHVIARRPVVHPWTGRVGYMLYVNDGVYGNFSSIMFDHQHPVARVLHRQGQFLYDQAAGRACSERDGTEYSVWGPTCDGIDRIVEATHFDGTLAVGDWLYFEGMGAYTRCSATAFNGFPDDHDVVYVCSEPQARALMPHLS